MRILSLRRGFEADHSSSTYEFFGHGSQRLEMRRLAP